MRVKLQSKKGRVRNKDSDCLRMETEGCKLRLVNMKGWNQEDKSFLPVF